MSDSEHCSTSEMSDVDRVTLWGKRKKLSSNTISQLLTLGFDSLEALALLTSDDLSKSKMPVGQSKLLLKAIQQTFCSTVTVQTAPTAQTPATTPVPEGDQIQTETAEPEDPFVQEVLNQLGAAQLAERGVAAPSRNPQTLGQEGMLSWQDPQIYLKSLVTPKAQSVHHDIVDYVNVLGVAMSEEYISCTANGQLVYKSGPAKPKLEAISQNQWSVANLAILYKLLEEGGLGHDQMLDYLSYTTRIYQLLSSFDQISVFIYDREYRRLQHMHKFRWGTDIPHLQTVHLKPRPLHPQSTRARLSGPPNTNAGHYASHTLLGNEICRLFNGRRGCKLTSCRFEHVCSVKGCTQAHPALEHTLTKSKN